MTEKEQTPSARVLIVDDEEDQRNGLASLAASWGYGVETAGDGQEALEKLASFSAHVMVTDLNMPRMDGFELLRRLSEGGESPPTIVLTAFGSMENALKTVHELGAYWFLEKPIQSSALKVLLARAAAQGRLAQQAERLERELSFRGVLEDLVGPSEAMQQVFSLIRQVASSRAAVFITGESGTGKELAARAIHNLSRRKSGPFVAVNCAALPETLIESELFGHEKGAFTGALQRRSGCFELADRGTLLLDEIGDMPIGTQAKLLRVLEDSKVRRLGGSHEFDVDVRVIASTNKDLREAIRQNLMREDLYYRLNVFHIRLPALRERPEDIPPITAALLRDLNKKHECRVVGLHRAVAENFQRYRWPGNVRELRNVLERAVILVGEGTVQASHLMGSLSEDAAGAPPRRAADPNEVTLRVGTTVREAEKALLLRTLDHTGNNKTRAARILDISLKTLHNKLKEYQAK